MNKKRGCRHPDRQTQTDTPPTFRVNNPNDPQLLLCHFESFFQVFHWLVWVTVIVVEEVGTMAVKNGTERQTIPPATVKVFDLHILIAGRREERRGG